METRDGITPTNEISVLQCVSGVCRPSGEAGVGRVRSCLVQTVGPPRVSDRPAVHRRMTPDIGRLMATHSALCHSYGRLVCIFADRTL